MAAPSPAAAPTLSTYHKMKDGYQTLITFTVNLQVALFQIDDKPPGVDGGEPINTTTMHNAAWETMAARSLKKLTDGSAKVNYNPVFYSECTALINVETTITIHLPNGSSYCFFGYLQKFEPAELKSGEFPEASITIVPTNTDSSGAEQGPVFTPAAGSA